jgi:hypothetical protein
MSAYNRQKNRNYQTSRQAHDHSEAQATALIRSAEEILGLSDDDRPIGRRADAPFVL